jgi:hypothetical protein
VSQAQLETLRTKLEEVITGVETARDTFQQHHPGAETTCQLRASFDALVSVDERLKDAVRYHPHGSCPR